MGKLFNRVQMTVSGTPGTGVVTLGSATSGFQSAAAAGVANADVVSYVFQDGTAWEYGQGTYATAGTTLTRTTVQASSAGGTTPISLTSGAVLTLTALASDISSKQDGSTNLTGWSGITTASKQDALGFTPLNKAGDTMSGGSLTGASVSMSMSADSGATTGNFVCKASGTGDANLAGMSFWNSAYAIKLGVRADGTFSLGGWSRAAHSWYSDASGNMVAAGNVTAYSDPRLKEKFETLADPFAILDVLEGGTFFWRSGIPHIMAKAGKRDYGILADQVQAVMPEIITESISIDGKAYLTVCYEKLVPVLIEAAKKSKQRIATLEGRLARLESLLP